jgi:hypothetical protein
LTRFQAPNRISFSFSTPLILCKEGSSAWGNFLQISVTPHPVPLYESPCELPLLRLGERQAVEKDKRLADYEAKAAEAERNAERATDPEIAKEWRAVAQVYRTMIGALRPQSH